MLHLLTAGVTKVSRAGAIPGGSGLGRLGRAGASWRPGHVLAEIARALGAKLPGQKLRGGRRLALSKEKAKPGISIT